MALQRDRESMTMASDANDDSLGTSDNGANDKAHDQRVWAAPNPVTRPTLFSAGGEDPLAQLDLYCQSHSKDRGNSNDNTKADVDELLSVAEFLFGQKALTAALTIVDSRRSLITKLVAPSGRFVHTIRSSSSSSSTMTAFDGSDANRRHDGDHYYLCIVSPSQSSRSLPPIRYCSCRSFFEKSTRKVKAVVSSLRKRNKHEYTANSLSNENQHDGPPVCKHLLALFLLPHLVAASEESASRSYNSSYRYSCPEIKSITEEEFATLVLDRIL